MFLLLFFLPEIFAANADSIIIAEVTDEFLDFSASKGNNLRDIGLTGGCRWCLCVSRWKEAFDARKGDQDKVVPKYVHV